MIDLRRFIPGIYDTAAVPFTRWTGSLRNLPVTRTYSQIMCAMCRPRRNRSFCLCLLFIREYLLLEVRIIDDLLQGHCDLCVERLKNVSNLSQTLEETSADHQLNEPFSICRIHNIASEGRPEPEHTSVRKTIFQELNDECVGNFSIWRSAELILLDSTIKF